MDTTEALKSGHLNDALTAAKDAVRKSPSDAKHRSVLFQLYCIAGNWEGAASQLKLVGEFDIEATLWVGVCEKLLACEAARREVFAGTKPPTLFGKPPEWVGGMLEAFRLGLEGKWQAAAASQAGALEAAPVTPAIINEQEVDWIADADSRFGPLLEAYIDGKYFWIPFEHIREINLRPRTHLTDAIWAPADFEWLNEGKATGYVPVRYEASEKNPDALVQLARKTEWAEKAENFYLGSGHRVLTASTADFDLGEIKLLRFVYPDVAVTAADIFKVMPGEQPESGPQASEV